MEQPRERFRFGGFELDVLAHELRRGEEVVPVEPRVLDVLVHLARHRDRVVSREELVDAVWPGTFITDSALAQAVLKARRAVDDDGRRQAVIRTVHGRGLRFVAEVEVEGSPAAVPIADSPRGADAPPPEPGRRLLPLLVAAAVAAAVVLAVVAGWQLRLRHGSDGPRRLAMLPFENRTGEATLEWVERGLPRLIGRVVEEGGGVELVAESQVEETLEAAGIEHPTSVDRSVFDRLQRALGVTHLAAAGVRREGGLYRLELEVWSRDRKPRRFDLSGARVPEILEPAARELRRRVVGGADQAPPPVVLSADPFVNQLYAMGLQEYARDNYRGAESYFRVCLDREPELAWAKHEIALCQRRAGAWEESLALSREVLEAAGAAEDWRLQNAALVNMGLASWRLGRLDEAERHLRAALVIADANDLRDRKATVLLNLGIVSADRGLLERAEGYERRALALFREMGSSSGEANALNSLGALAWRRGDLATSRAMHERALAIRRELGARERIAASLNNLGTVARADGRWQEASALFDEALSIRLELGDRLGEASTLYNLSVMALLRCEPGESRRLAEQSLAIASELGNRRREAWNLAQLAAVARAERRTAEAAERSAAALEVYRELGDRAGEAGQLLLLAELALERLDLAEAWALVGRAQALADELDDPGLAGTVVRARGDLARAAGDRGAAERAYRDALDLSGAAGNSFATMETAVRLGSLLLDAGRSEEAADLADDLGQFSTVHPPAMLVTARLRAALGEPGGLELARAARAAAGPLWSEEQAAALAALESGAPPRATAAGHR